MALKVFPLRLGTFFAKEKKATGIAINYFIKFSLISFVVFQQRF